MNRDCRKLNYCPIGNLKTKKLGCMLKNETGITTNASTVQLACLDDIKII